MGAVNTCVGHSRFWILIDAGLVTREAAGGGEVRHRSQMKSNGGIWRRRRWGGKIKSKPPLLHWESSSSPSLLVFHPLTVPHPLPLPLPHLLLLPLPIALPHPLLYFYLYPSLSLHPSLTCSLYLILSLSLYLTLSFASTSPSTSPSPSPSDSTSPSPSLPRLAPRALSCVLHTPPRR